MNNNQKLTPQQLQALAEKYSKGKSIDADALSKAINSNDINSFVQNNLSKEQSEKLSQVLNDEKALKELLNSPQAQKIMKSFMGE